MFSFEFTNKPIEPSHSHSDLEFFYILDGTVVFSLEDKQYLLRKDDFLVVNVDRVHSYRAEGSFLGAYLRISFTELCRKMHQSMVFLWCNTAVISNEACLELRSIFKKLLAEQYFHQGEDPILLDSLCYSFLHVLLHDFQLNKDDHQFREESHKFDLRKHEIDEYIRLNFDKQLSLEALADKLYLSYAYLSKYIKKTFGMGFADYVNTVRLSFAVSQLLHSDQPMVKIALDAGFASSAALNKAFKEKYAMTPTEYRRKWGKQDRGAREQQEQQGIRQQLARHFDRTPQLQRQERTTPGELICAMSLPKRPLKRNWAKMINVGSAADLLRSDMQQHVVALQKELHFEYARVWDLYAPEMLLDPRDGQERYNFDNLDRVLDFLLANGMKPYLELREKPKVILHNRDKYRFRDEKQGQSYTLEQMEQLVGRLMVHLLNRYPMDTLESWYFELWHAEPEEVWTQMDKAPQAMPSSEYIRWFSRVSRVLRGYLPGIRLGGGGFSLRYGEELFRSLLTQWKTSDCLPDFLSIYCYPYSQDSIVMDRNQSRNANFVFDTLTRVRQLIEETGFPAQELHVSEWNFSVSNRNLLNDHCMKGAYLVRNLIDCIELADVMGYWVGSDLYAVHYDTTTVLNGSSGLLSKDGIRKPAYFAFDFMNHLGKYLRKKGEHYIITDNGAGNWRIVCHNLKGLNYQYGLYNEDELQYDEQNNLFEDMKSLRLSFELPGKKGGEYLLRIYSVSPRFGSLQDALREMSAPRELTAEDLRYLYRVTTPRLTMRTCTAENGRLSFEVELEPNEIVYLHASYQYH